METVSVGDYYTEPLIVDGLQRGRLSMEAVSGTQWEVRQCQVSLQRGRLSMETVTSSTTCACGWSPRCFNEAVSRWRRRGLVHRVWDLLGSLLQRGRLSMETLR